MAKYPLRYSTGCYQTLMKRGHRRIFMLHRDAPVHLPHPALHYFPLSGGPHTACSYLALLRHPQLLFPFSFSFRWLFHGCQVTTASRFGLSFQPHRAVACVLCLCHTQLFAASRDTSSRLALDLVFLGFHNSDLLAPAFHPRSSLSSTRVTRGSDIDNSGGMNLI